MRLAEHTLSAREALKPLLKALAYVVFALYLALGTIAVAIFAVRHGLPIIVVIAAPFLLILFALLETCCAACPARLARNFFTICSQQVAL
jgi:hypothetical protein